jgi:ATP-binding cassette subfamily F protein 3
VATGDIRLRINDILGAFMFGGEASEKKVKFLSGGERSRLAMIKLLLEPVNLLILDEPTNHLDMPSKDVLKEAIKAFDGTAIIVSHDREFLDGLVSKVYEFGGGKVREYLGGIYDWINKAPLQLPPTGGVPNGAEKKVANSIPQELKANPSVESAAGALSYAERKELLKKKSRLEKSIKEVEKKIETLETRIAELDAILCTPEGASDMTVVTEYTSTKRLIDQETDRWAQLSEELETIEL